MTEILFNEQKNGYDKIQVDSYIQKITEAYQTACKEYQTTCEKYNNLMQDYEMMMSSDGAAEWKFDINGNMTEYEEPSDTWAQEKIGVAAAHDSATGDGVTIALLDTGIDTDHPDLATHLVDGRDFVNNDDSVNDSEWYYDQWHATNIAGIIAGSAPDAMIMPLKIFQGGKAYTSDISGDRIC